MSTKEIFTIMTVYQAKHHVTKSFGRWEQLPMHTGLLISPEGEIKHIAGGKVPKMTKTRYGFETYILRNIDPDIKNKVGYSREDLVYLTYVSEDIPSNKCAIRIDPEKPISPDNLKLELIYKVRQGITGRGTMTTMNLIHAVELIKKDDQWVETGKQYKKTAPSFSVLIGRSISNIWYHLKYKNRCPTEHIFVSKIDSKRAYRCNVVIE